MKGRISQVNSRTKQAERSSDPSTHGAFHSALLERCWSPETLAEVFPERYGLVSGKACISPIRAQSLPCDIRILHGGCILYIPNFG